MTSATGTYRREIPPGIPAGALTRAQFPPPGMLLPLVFPASANASALVFVRLPGAPAAALVNAVNGRRRAGQETIRCTGGYAHAARGEPYLMREVLGGGPGCRSGKPLQAAGGRRAPRGARRPAGQPFPGRGPRCRRLSGSLGAAEAGRL